jgi:hypothetical protein
MVKISTVIALGFFVALIPFTGLPNDNEFPLKNILFVLCGLIIAFLSWLIRMELEKVVKHLHSDIKTDTYSESIPKAEENKVE